MHTEEYQQENLFWAGKLSEIEDHWYAYLGQDWDDFYFIRNIDWNYLIKCVQKLEDSDISDRMYADFDDHEAWVNAVRNGDTDESYDSWRQDIDIWEECDAEDYYSCPTKVVNILYELWLWPEENHASDGDWYYLDEYSSTTINTDTLENIYRRLNPDWKFNQSLRDDLEQKYLVNQVEFLAAEPIR